jgi:acetoin utilization deacetylase AcuC-like enzyme
MAQVGHGDMRVSSSLLQPHDLLLVMHQLPSACVRYPWSLACLPGAQPGWCIFNDQAVAARAAQRDAGITRVLFVDLDVHQGDGTVSTRRRRVGEVIDTASMRTVCLHLQAQMG